MIPPSVVEDFNPRPPCGGRRDGEWTSEDVIIISIHVPRVEDDKGESSAGKSPALFQSTSPVWRTTNYRRTNMNNYEISIHVPRVEDDSVLVLVVNPAENFNPRPPCGGRRNVVSYARNIWEFQSTSPVWRTTQSI